MLFKMDECLLTLYVWSFKLTYALWVGNWVMYGEKKDDVYSTARAHCHVHLLHNWMFVFLLFLLSAIVLTVVWSIAFDYPVGIFKLFGTNRSQTHQRWLVLLLSFVTMGKNKIHMKTSSYINNIKKLYYKLSSFILSYSKIKWNN